MNARPRLPTPSEILYSGIVSVDRHEWRNRGRRLRALESVMNTPRAATRAEALRSVQLGLQRALSALPAEEREIAAAHAAGGYLTEHLAHGGTVDGD